MSPPNWWILVDIFVVNFFIKKNPFEADDEAIKMDREEIETNDVEFRGHYYIHSKLETEIIYRERESYIIQIVCFSQPPLHENTSHFCSTFHKHKFCPFFPSFLRFSLPSSILIQAVLKRCLGWQQR